MERGYGSFTPRRLPTDGKGAQSWTSKYVQSMWTLAQRINEKEVSCLFSQDVSFKG